MLATAAGPVASARHCRSFMLLALLVAALALTGCAGKSEGELASDALAAGLAAHTAGKIDEAAGDFRECLKHDSRNKFCYFNLGVIAQGQNNPAEAENDYRIALGIDPNFPSAIWNLALVRAGAGATAEAIDLWRHYLRLDAGAAGAHWNLALLLRATGKQGEGDAEMTLAHQLDPSLADPAGTGASAPSPSGSGAAGSPGASASP